MNRNLSKIKEQTKQILQKKIDKAAGTALPLRGNEVGACVQYLINSKQPLWLERRKGKMIMKLERCWGPNDGGAELSGSPRSLYMPSNRRALTSLGTPTHLYPVCPRTIRINPIALAFLAIPIRKRNQDLSPGFYAPHCFTHPVF